MEQKNQNIPIGGEHSRLSPNTVEGQFEDPFFITLGELSELTKGSPYELSDLVTAVNAPSTVVDVDDPDLNARRVVLAGLQPDYHTARAALPFKQKDLDKVGLTKVLVETVKEQAEQKPNVWNAVLAKQLEEVVRVAEGAPDPLTGDGEIDDMLRQCIETLATKGAEYTVGSPDRLANFRGVAEDVGIPMEKAWYCFFNKHLRAVQSYIKSGCQVKSEETIHGRIMDCVVYLLLFEKMTLEIERMRALKQGASLGVGSGS